MKDRKKIIFFSVLIALDTTLIALFSGRIPMDYYWLCLGLGILTTYITWEANLFVHTVLEKKFPVKTHIVQRIQWQAILNIIITSVIIKAYFFFYFTFVVKTEVPKDILFSNIFVAVVISLLINAIYIGYELFVEWKNALEEKESFKKASLQSQFAALKNQVNPHFLFNSLNTLASIIPEDQKLSVEFVQKLSNVYRYVLQNKDKELVDLKTELDFIQSYLFLLKIRFGENIQTSIDIPDHLNYTSVAPLTLQMLVENAIKHNIISTAQPLDIRIYAEKEDTIVVKNTLQKKLSSDESTGIGLQNIINRYKFLTSKPVEVIITAANFIVALPLLKPDTYESAHY